MNCKKCGAVLNEGNLFCNQCGQPINAEGNSKNDISNMSFQNSNVERENVNSNTQSNQYNQQYNNYNPASSGKGKAGNIFLIIILAIVFLSIGFFFGKLMFGEKDSENNVNNNSSLSTLNSSNSTTDKKDNKNSSKNFNGLTNYITTNDNKRITFKVADTLKEDRVTSDINCRCFKKANQNDANKDLVIFISRDSSTVEEYMEELEDYVNNDNVQLSEIKTKTVNGKKFYCRFIDYDMEKTESNEAYFVCEIEEDSLYTVRVEQYNLLTNEELNGLLSIDISK